MESNSSATALRKPSNALEFINPPLVTNATTPPSSFWTRSDAKRIAFVYGSYSADRWFVFEVSA